MLAKSEIKVLQRCVEMASEWTGSLDPEDVPEREEFISGAYKILNKLSPVLIQPNKASEKVEIIGREVRHVFLHTNDNIQEVSMVIGSEILGVCTTYDYPHLEVLQPDGALTETREFLVTRSGDTIPTTRKLKYIGSCRHPDLDSSVFDLDQGENRFYVFELL